MEIMEQRAAISGKTALRVINANNPFGRETMTFFEMYRDRIDIDSFIFEARREGWSLRMIYHVGKSSDPIQNDRLKLKLGHIFDCY